MDDYIPAGVFLEAIRKKKGITRKNEVKMDEIDLHLTMDATIWADEFNRIFVKHGEQPIDHEVLVSWFANSIMTGYDHAMRLKEQTRNAGVKMDKINIDYKNPYSNHSLRGYDIEKGGRRVKMDKVKINTDKELWRKIPNDFYSPSIHVTEKGFIGINCRGHVIVSPIEKWFDALDKLCSRRKYDE